MEHVKLEHYRSAEVVHPDGYATIVIATHFIAWVEGYERPLLCARMPGPERFIGAALDLDNQTHTKLWTSPLHYADPPLAGNDSPTGCPWVVYCEKDFVANEPLPPMWFTEVVRAGDKPGNHWEPLSAAWKLKDALAPVVDVVRKRHQPFLARLTSTPYVSKARGTISRILDEGAHEGVCLPINIGERTCPMCDGQGYIVSKMARQKAKVINFGTNNPLPGTFRCGDCNETGTLPRWSLSIQCGVPFGSAPMLRKSAVDNDLSAYYLWEVSSNIDVDELRDILSRYPPTSNAAFMRIGSEDFNRQTALSRFTLAARTCGVQEGPDPARDVTAEDIQTVIDALEWEAANTGGPMLAPPDDKPIDTTELLIVNPDKDGSTRTSAKNFVDSLRRGDMPTTDLEKLRDTWRANWPEVAEYIDRVFAGDPYTDIVVQRRPSKESQHQPYYGSVRDTSPGVTSVDDSLEKVFARCVATPHCQSTPRVGMDLCETHYQEMLHDTLVRGLGTSFVFGPATPTPQANAAGERVRQGSVAAAPSFKRKNHKKGKRR